MKILNNIFYIGAALALLTACNSDDDFMPAYTVGEAVNAITLHAGIYEGSNGVVTRGVDENHASDVTYGGGHVPFSSTTTQLRLRIDGKWVGKADNYVLPHGKVVSETASQITTASVGESISVGTETTATHNKIVFASTEQLYWDDYGTADPNNKGDVTKGRDIGLTIYGVAIDGQATAPVVNNWSALEWNLSNDQSETGVWGKEDLLISNNISETGDGTYKFDNYIYDLTNTPKMSSNLLEFTHAMSKITVNLIAGDGFPSTGVGATAKRFVSEPEAVLTSNLYGTTSKTEWTYTKGSVNVITGAVSSPDVLTPITMKTTSTASTEFTVVKEALVVPGSTFADAVSSVYPQVLSILADGNRYYVSSEKMRQAISSAQLAGKHGTDFVTESGKNYIFKVTINKTGIDVTATIKDWVNITADPETPIINFSDCYGQTGDGFNKGFTFYRSPNSEYSFISGLTEGNRATVNYADSKYSMTPQLYWPDHSTHYYFRGVWPCVNTPDGPAETRVKADGIVVANGSYTPNKYPSDLMIGMPRKDDGTPDEHCKSSHNVDGICATDATDGVSHDKEGLIHLNFQYAMSQVIVKLETTTGDDKVTIDSNTKVDILNIFNSGDIKLSDGSSVFDDKTPETHTMTNDNNIANPESNNYANYRSTIIPQNLTNTTGDLKFRITVQEGTSKDVYETPLGIKKIEVSENGGSKQLIDEWKPGKVYIYTLTLKKTEINVTATIKDWIPVEARDEVWF